MTGLAAPVTRLPLLSITLTAGAGLRIVPAIAFAGCVLNTRWAALLAAATAVTCVCPAL